MKGTTLRNTAVCLLTVLCAVGRWASAGGPVTGVPGAAEASYNRKEDVIYGRKYGTALTMDVFTPKEKANGAAIVFCVSGGWFSSHEAINAGFIMEFLNRGYTCFAVVHGSQPKFYDS